MTSGYCRFVSVLKWAAGLLAAASVKVFDLNGMISSSRLAGLNCSVYEFAQQ
jgi:hypothetical protein